MYPDRRNYMINGKKVGFYANGTFKNMPIEKTCHIIAGMGYDGIELDREWLNRCDSDGELGRQCRWIEASGLELSEVILQLDYVEMDEDLRRRNIQETIEGIRRCGNEGIRTVNLFTGPRPWAPRPVCMGEDLTVYQAWKMVFAAFDEILPAAEKYGVQLAVENVWGMMCHDFFTMQFLVNTYQSPYLGVNFDPSHDLLAGNTDMEFLIRYWGKQKIKHIHLKDAAGIQTRGRVLFPPLGEGCVDWTGFLRGLDAIGYDGILSVEYEAEQHLEQTLKGDWVQAAQESYDTLTRLLS